MARVWSNSVTAAVPVVTTAETVAITTTPVSVSDDHDQISILCSLDFLAGTGTTSVTLRCRRGTGATGTIVGVAETDSLAAGNTEIFTILVTDLPGPVAGQTYSITVQQTAATGNGSVVASGATVTVGQP